MFVSANKPCGHRSSTVSTRFSFVRFLLCVVNVRGWGVTGRRLRMFIREEPVIYSSSISLTKRSSSIVQGAACICRLVKCYDLRGLVRSYVRASCVRAFVRSFVQLYVFLPSCPVRSSRVPRLPSPVSHPSSLVPRPRPQSLVRLSLATRGITASASGEAPR